MRAYRSRNFADTRNSIKENPVKLIRTMGIVAALAFAATALLGVSSASALTVEACNATECKSALSGDTFNAIGTKVTLRNESKSFENVCEGVVEGEVLDPVSTSGTDKIQADLTFAEFAPCEPFEVLVNEATLPWELLTDTAAFPKGLVEGGVLVTIHAVGECKYAETVSDMVHLKWTNALPKSSVTLEGALSRENNNVFCPSLGIIEGKYTVGTVTAADLASANNVEIL
jgi:hypothetical protein